MTDLNLFIPLKKVDEESRLIYGTAAEEIMDRSGEIFDYEASKPRIQAWSNEVAKLSEGKSLGNVRAMHKNISAGKLTDIAFMDDARRVDVVAKIVDDDEWRKVQEGVYTGFSFGGKYGRRWTDVNGCRRYEAVPTELSLGDLAAIPSATFTLVKIDGTEVEVPFKRSSQQETDLLAKTAELGLDAETAATALAFLVENAGREAVLNPLSSFGAGALKKRDFSEKAREKDSDSGKAMPDGSFPIESKKDLGNALKAYGRAKDPEAAKKHIMMRAKALGLEDALPSDWKEGKKLGKIAGAEDLKKYLGQEAWDVRMALNALDYLFGLYSAEASETHPEAAFQTADLKEAIDRIKSFIASEIQETDPSDPSMAKTAGTLDLAKTGAAISAENMKLVQAIHDHTSTLGASCGMEKIAGASDLAKIASLEADLAKIAGENQTLKARVKELEDQPEPAKGAHLDLSKLFAIGKDDEALGLEKTAEGEAEKTPVDEIKHIHRSGGRIMRF